MSGYFKPMRRKLGVVTISLVCVVMVGAIRNHTTCDVVAFNRSEPKEKHLLISSPMGLCYLCHVGLSEPNAKALGFASYTWPFKNGEDFFSAGKMDWKINTFGFRSGDNRSISGNPTMYNVVRIIPYWSIVIPLTLISAWLLISKPRPLKRNVIEPPTTPES